EAKRPGRDKRGKTMTADVLLRACHAQAQLLDDLIEPWQHEYETAELVSAIEALLPKLVATCQVFQELDKSVWSDVWAGRIKNMQSYGEQLRGLWDNLVKLLDKVRKSCHLLRDQGYAVQGLDLFENSVEDIRRVRDALIARWPWIDPQQIEESRAAYDRGEYQ